MIHLIVLIILAYLIGSIPTAILVSKGIYKKDVRQFGSKNAGATNVFRVLGWKPGLFVLLFDMFKGYFSTAVLADIIMKQSGMDVRIELFMMIAGFAAVFGHIWTIFAGFKGGKGVATGAGMLIGLAPGVVGICIVIFILVFLVSRMVSLGSITAAVSFPVILWIEKLWMNKDIYQGILYFSILIPLLIIYTHRENIKRILNGTENKIEFGKKAGASNE
jgi:glycerol-3-phosphate acyltransferase PlsY